MTHHQKYFDYEAISSRQLSGDKKQVSKAIDIVISKLNKGKPLLPHQANDLIRLNRIRKELLTLPHSSNLVDHLVTLAYDEIDKNEGRPNNYFHQIDEIIKEANKLLPSSKITVIMNTVCNFDEGQVLPNMKKFAGNNPILYAYTFQKIVEHKNNQIQQEMELALFHNNNNKNSPAYVDCLLQKEAYRRLESRVKRTITGYRMANKVLHEFDMKDDEDFLEMEEREREIKELTGSSTMSM